MVTHLASAVWFEECCQGQKRVRDRGGGGGRGGGVGGGAVFLEKQHWQPRTGGKMCTSVNGPKINSCIQCCSGPSRDGCVRALTRLLPPFFCSTYSGLFYWADGEIRFADGALQTALCSKN